MRHGGEPSVEGNLPSLLPGKSPHFGADAPPRRESPRAFARRRAMTHSPGEEGRRVGS